MKENSSIIQYLTAVKTMLTGKQAEYYKWVLEHGKYFDGKSRDKETERKMIEMCFSHSEMECYYNSQMLVLNGRDFEYYEGWYVPDKLFPISHGFVVSNGRVVDVTVNSRHEVLEYFGVNIPNKFVASSIKRRKITEPLIVEYWRSELNG